MKSIRKSILGVGLALFIIFVSSGFLLFTWNSTVGYYTLVLSASFLCGTITVDFEKSLKILLVTFVASVIMFVWLTTLPPTIYGESHAGEINALVTLISTEYSRTLIISFPTAVFACLFGCFFGRSFAESE
jgi:hypothetical protein